MNYFPNRVYPETPQFPIGHEDVPTGTDLYTAVSTYIEALATDAARIFNNDGNIALDAAFGVNWDGTNRITLVSGEIHFTGVSVNVELVVDTPTITTLSITGNFVIDNDLIIDGDIAVTGTVTQDYVERDYHKFDQAAEPGDPAEDTAVLWLSNGTGFGDVADLVCKITEGGGTTSFTIADYSTL